LNGNAQQEGLKAVTDKVLHYFKEFISTDFKRQQAPRRRIQLKTKEGFRTAIDLRKYPTFFRDAWSLLSKNPQAMSLRIGRKTYRASISPILYNLMKQYVRDLPTVAFQDIRNGVLAKAEAKRMDAAANVERFCEEIVAYLHERTAKEVVLPLLTLLEGPFKESAYSAEDSIFEVESDLTEILCAACAEQLPVALNTFLLSGREDAIRLVLNEFLADEVIRSQTLEFFETFAAADAYMELRDVLNYTGSDDTLTTYLYFGAIKFGPNDYPLFYLPATITVDSEGAGYVLNLDPRLYVHKQAIEYIAAEMRNQAERVSVAVIPERIIHLGEGDTAQARVEQVMKNVGRTFDLASQVKFDEARPQIARSPQLRVSNAAYLASFDRSDESLVNDYEALLSSLDDDHKAASDMFGGIVKAMLFDDPISVSADVRADWSAMSPAQHLVTTSPIPLNEEQIRIDNARKKPGCRFIAVEGPPGTGKSHTITALAFNAIMDHQSVLIVSDKNEALDVVQEKLETALVAIRTGDDFPNPILRLGKDGTYRSLISGSSKVRIQNHHAAQATNMPAVERELTDKKQNLSGRIGETVNGLSSIEVVQIARLHEIEAHLVKAMPTLPITLDALVRKDAVLDLLLALDSFPVDMNSGFEQVTARCKTLNDIVSVCAVHAVVGACLAGEVGLSASVRQSLSLFDPMPASKGPVVLKFLTRIEALKMPVLGYLFRKSALAAMDAEIADALSSPAPVGLSRRLDDLRNLTNLLSNVRGKSQEVGLPDEITVAVYRMLQSGEMPYAGARAAHSWVGRFKAVLERDPAVYEVLARQQTMSLGQLLLNMTEFLRISSHLTKQFGATPQMDFVREKSRLEALNTARLAHQLDTRFLNFVENNRATAQALGGVIKQRAQFPVDQFKTLREAFPCVIAGIRELGEFVPMKSEVFDLLIIDEGSQVSVAQAMPAMLRAKQVVIFGDRKQFSNVKSHNASNMTNASYLSDLQDHFRQNVSNAADKLDRLQRFDVKRSVLEFVELVANHTEMLRKHFRGYPELISYSSKHFYDGALQAIKVRPVPLTEVFRFEILDHDKRVESKRNTNSMEAQRILEILEELCDEENAPSVAIITPHTEQVALISGLVWRHAKADDFAEKLRLKVFSFDTCQGEERDIIIYSMVATRERDVLNYIFPVQLGVNEDENDTLKAQRLNVGFSRAKEGMIFVLSKPAEEFKGTIGQALLHYQRILDQGSIAEYGDTDANSPMEQKLLGWLKATSFFQMEDERIELIAQFPVGEYLRQLDPLYRHPAYKTDFLLRHMGDDLTNIIIEYDGFEHHFVSREKVNAATFERYYKPEDVERQFVLESYGYRFLRVNRFNLGDDPVATLDARLREMVDLAKEDGGSDPADLVGRIKAQAQALDDKEAKLCSKCKKVMDLKDFFDPNLASGKGGYGRVCMGCKLVKPVTTPAEAKRPAFYRRKWRRY
jgi:hypothetical protein